MSGTTVDTSVLVAGVAVQHERHTAATAALDQVDFLLTNCLAETWSVLSRGVFRLPPETVARIVEQLRDQVVDQRAVSAEAYSRVFDHGELLRLAGDVHDAAIAAACAELEARLLTMDRGQHALAQAFGVDSHLLL